MEDKSSHLLQHQHTCCCLFGPSLPIVLWTDSFICGFLLIFLQKGPSYFHPSIPERKRYLCTLNLSWSGCFYLESKLAKRKWRKGKNKHNTEVAVGDCLCLNMAYEKKDFVNSTSVQNRMLSEASCLLSQGCQHLTLNVIRETQIKGKCGAGRT